MERQSYPHLHGSYVTNNRSSYIDRRLWKQFREEFLLTEFLLTELKKTGGKMEQRTLVMIYCPGKDLSIGPI